MSTPKNIQDYMQDNKVRKANTVLDFLHRNIDMPGAMTSNDFLIEYVKEDDHLYATFGEPRPGMAILFDNVVAIADPETLECISVEVLNFTEDVSYLFLQGLCTALFEHAKAQAMMGVPPGQLEVPPITDLHLSPSARFFKAGLSDMFSRRQIDEDYEKGYELWVDAKAQSLSSPAR